MIDPTVNFNDKESFKNRRMIFISLIAFFGAIAVGCWLWIVTIQAQERAAAWKIYETTLADTKAAQGELKAAFGEYEEADKLAASQVDILSAITKKLPKTWSNPEEAWQEVSNSAASISKARTDFKNSLTVAAYSTVLTAYITVTKDDELSKITSAISEAKALAANTRTLASVYKTAAADISELINTNLVALDKLTIAIIKKSSDFKNDRASDSSRAAKEKSLATISALKTGDQRSGMQDIADAIFTYVKAVESEKASHDEVVAAEKAAAEKEARAAEEARSRNYGGGSSGSGGGSSSGSGGSSGGSSGGGTGGGSSGGVTGGGASGGGGTKLGGDIGDPNRGPTGQCWTSNGTGGLKPCGT